MGLVILARPPLPHIVSLAVPCSNRRAPLPSPAGCRCRRLVPVRRLRPSWSYVYRFNSLTSKCSITHADVDLDQVETEDEVPEALPSISPACSIPLVHHRTGILDSEPLNFLGDEQFMSNLLTALPVLSEEEQDALAATPAHPSGLYALYASSLAGNWVEQLWNFAWPAAVALLHPSLLPVGVLGFFTKLSIFAGGPLIEHFMDSFPRIPICDFWSLIQTVAKLLSATMIIYAHNTLRHASVAVVLLQPWFIVLPFATAIERLGGLALRVTMECDWVMLLAGTNRSIALAEANAMLNRVDLLCEIAGPSLFGFSFKQPGTQKGSGKHSSAIKEAAPAACVNRFHNFL